MRRWRYTISVLIIASSAIFLGTSASGMSRTARPQYVLVPPSGHCPTNYVKRTLTIKRDGKRVRIVGCVFAPPTTTTVAYGVPVETLTATPRGFLTTNINQNSPCFDEFSGGTGAMCVVLTTTLQLNGYVVQYPFLSAFMVVGVSGNSSVVNDLGEGPDLEFNTTSTVMEGKVYVMVGGESQSTFTPSGGKTSVLIEWTLPNQETISRTAKISVTRTGVTRVSYSLTSIQAGS